MPVRRIMRLTPFRVRQRILHSVERRVLRFIPHQRRLKVVRRATPFAAPARLATRARPEFLWVRVGKRFVRARKETLTTPTVVRKDNLDAVTTALDAAGVPWFRIPVEQPGRTGVAVGIEHRDTVLAALDGLRVQVALPRRRRFRPPVRRRQATVLTVSSPVTDPTGSLLLGRDYACEVEFWRAVGDALVAPRPNPVADEVPVAEPVVRIPESVLSAYASAKDTTAYPSRSVYTMTAPERVRFPVDVVYTWVDGNDPAWQARKAAALAGNGWLAAASEQSANNSRFASRDELRYSLRSLAAYAPWVRRIFLVTDDQVPGWLDTTNDQVTVVTHRELFAGTGTLPTFNSQAIESRLHLIPGLAEHFLYLNDDVFFGRPVTPELFFTAGGLTRMFPSRALMGSGPVRGDDAPVNAAGKNNRALIEQTFGCRITQKFMHTPHPSRRSVLAELEERFPAEVAATASHQFRHPADLALPSSLQHYWGLLTGRSVPGQIRYMYCDLGEPVTPIRLARLLRQRHLDVFCLNDTDSDPSVAIEQAALLRDFLPAYFPFPSPYELAGPEGDRPTYAAAPAAVARQVPREPVVPAPAPKRSRRNAGERRGKAKNTRTATPVQKKGGETIHS